MLKTLFIAGTGGFIGTVLRFLVSRYFQENTFSLFPWGTFTVNIVGSLLIGIFYGMSERGNLLSPEIRIFLTVGICGGFTTFSSLSNDAFSCGLSWSDTYKINLKWKLTRQMHYSGYLSVQPIS